MMVFLDVLGPLGLKIVKIDPPSGTPPGLKILKNRPQNRKNRNRSDFRFFCLTKSLGNWILTEIDTLKPIFDRPVPELDRFLCFDFCAALRGWESTHGGDGKLTAMVTENLAGNKNRSSSGTGRSKIGFKVSISVKIQFPSDFVKQKNRKSERFRFFRFWWRFFKIFSLWGVPEGGSIFTILSP